MTERESASAVVVPRPEGTFVHRLRSGSWRLLFGGDFLDPDSDGMPTGTDSVLSTE